MSGALPTSSTGGAAPEEPVGATISNDDLSIQLRARSDAKLRRDFTAADAIRSGLEAHGIRITDSTRSWAASDGRKGNTTGPDFFALAGTPFAPGGGGYTPQPPYGAPPAYGAPPQSAPVAPGALPTEVLFAKLKERESSRMARDYARSDEMRDELRRAGVQIDDRLKTWSTTDGRSGTLHNNTPALNPPGGAAYGAGAYGAPPGYGGGYGYGAPPAYGQQAGGYGAYSQGAYGQQQQQYAYPPQGYPGQYPGYPQPPYG